MATVLNPGFPPGAGVMTIVHGNLQLVEMAVTLARSIRLRDPDLPLAVVTHFDAALYEGMFDHVISWDFSRWSYYDAKLDMYAMSPFETTLFLDADMLVYQSLAGVFACFAGEDFGVVGYNVKDLGWFGSMDLIRREFPSDTYCRYNGGLYFFRRSELAARIFQQTVSIHERYDELGIKRHTGHKDEQPIMCLAMAEAGVKARSRGSGKGYLIDTWWPQGFRIESDVLSGRCVQSKRDRQGQVILHQRVFLHFMSSLKSSYKYRYESLRLRWTYKYARRGRGVDFILRFFTLFLWMKDIFNRLVTK